MPGGTPPVGPTRRGRGEIAQGRSGSSTQERRVHSIPAICRQGENVSHDQTSGVIAPNGAVEPAARSEQVVIDQLYARLDELRERAADDLAAVRRTRSGGTHQSRSERDAYATLYEDRLAQLRAVEDRLCFGRLDLRGGEYRYIGRIGLADEEQHRMLVDWRAEAAMPFYQATAARPLDVVRRRHVLTRHRQVTSVEDEVLDLDALERDGRLRQPGRRGRADGRGQRPAHRQDGRHRGHHPGRAGRDHPLRACRGARGRGRPGHRQDRRGSAPRGLPPLQPP